ncbi:MAG: response regulator [Gemmatimonadota bacterium]|jgi:DNA-binding NarL/FixJ family response regulator|nr:response regulator transcription factor [Gemmatimonadota bacterium]
MTRIRVVLADDHELVLEGLRALLSAERDIEVVATTTSGEQLVELVRRHRPDVAVLDLEMGTMSGLACLQKIRAEKLPVRVLVLTAYNDGASIRAALEGGADGFALKTEPPQQTVSSVRQVVRGQLVFPAAAKRWLLGREATPEAEKLTEREQAVLAHVAEGVTNAEIARQLRVSENTVKFHLQNLYLKLGVSNRTEAAAHFLRERALRRV